MKFHSTFHSQKRKEVHLVDVGVLFQAEVDGACVCGPDTKQMKTHHEDVLRSHDW